MTGVQTCALPICTLKDVGDNSVVDMLMDLGATIIDRQVQEMRNIEVSLKN